MIAIMCSQMIMIIKKGKMIMNEKEQIIKKLEYLKDHSFDASRKTDCSGSCRSTYIECCMWLSFLCLLDDAIRYIEEH